MLDSLAIALLNGELRGIRDARVERPRRRHRSRPRLLRRSDRRSFAPAVATG